MDDHISRIRAALQPSVLYLFTDSGNHAFSADDIRALLDRLDAAEAENIEADAKVTRDETVRMLADTLQAVRAERDRLRQIAYDAATSLESISKLAGLAQYMDTMSDIRAYARSRADFSRAALENTNG